MKTSLKTIIENKYSHFLFSLAFLFLIAAFIDDFQFTFPITHFFLFIITIATLRVLNPPEHIFSGIVIFACVALVLEYALNAGIIPAFNAAGRAAVLLFYIILIGLAIIFLIKNVFSEKSVTNLEAVAGQVYITVFIARLVGLHIMRAYDKKTIDPGRMDAPE